MKGDAKVIDYLNKGLRSELTAINQYWLHYRLLDNWGYNELAKKWREESIEEMHHADKFVDRILFLEGFPNMQVLDPLRIGQNVKEILECDLQAEVDARALYQEAATHCHSVKDYPSRDLFEQLMADEEDHIDFLETQLDLVEKLGIQLYSQAHVGKPEKPGGGDQGRRAEPRSALLSRKSGASDWVLEAASAGMTYGPPNNCSANATSSATHASGLLPDVSMRACDRPYDVARASRIATRSLIA